ncbi:MAG: pyridoxamine 5'-phosphate oxidase family protein [Halieaceae bacterium]
MAEATSNYDDVRMYGMDADREQELLDKQKECTFIWTNKAGEPVGVIMSYIFRDGKFWLTATRHRKRIPAIRRDPRVCIVVTSNGTDMQVGKALTYKGTAEVHESREVKDKFYPDFAAAIGVIDPPEIFVEFLDTEDRVVIEVTPTKSITYDGDKMADATAKFLESRQG